MRPISSHALYLDLLLDLGLSYGDDLTIFPWDDPSKVARKSLAKSFLKKFKDDIDEDLCDQVAFDKFLSANSRCETWQLRCENLLDDLLVGTLKKYLSEFFCPRSKHHHLDGRLTYEQGPLIHSFGSILDGGRCGPGSSVGSESGDFYTKLFDSKLSCTSAGLRRAYTNYISDFPLWREAEETRFSAWGEASVVEGNRLDFVPKDATTSRSICIEPSLNMFFQLGVGSLIEKRLKYYFGIDLERQPDINRKLAHLGSVTGDFVTIDLSSASDSISHKMLKSFLPQSFTQWVDLIRSPRSIYKGVPVELHMTSTMGNGFTFPLQTAIFSCVVAACFEIDGLVRVDSPQDLDNRFSQRLPNWSVFGDDIICHKRLFAKVIRLLTLIGFEVNSDKTFSEGLFRESCGFDFFNGVNVRGIYCKTLGSPQDRYTLINLLNAWSNRTGIPVPKTIRRLLQSVPRIVVPPWENADCGIWVPERGLSILGIDLRRSRNGSILYRRFVPKNISFYISDERIHVPRRMKPRRYNPAGLYLAFLNGTITGGRILVRSNKVRYVTKWAVAPNWRYHPTVQSPFKDSVGGPGLETPELINLISAW